jgi:hypothetical protein
LAWKLLAVGFRDGQKEGQQAVGFMATLPYLWPLALATA